MKKAFIILLGIICCVGCTNINAPLTEDQINAVKKEAKQATSAYIDAIERNDLQAITSFFDESDDFRLILDGQAYNYKSFIKMANEFLPSVDRQVMDTKDEIFTVIASNCFTHYWTGFNGMYLKDGKDMTVDNFFMTYIYKKINGQWKIIHAHESWAEMPMSQDSQEIKEE